MHNPNGRAKEESSEISEPGQIDRFICFLLPSTINCMATWLLCFCIIHFFFFFFFNYQYLLHVACTSKLCVHPGAIIRRNAGLGERGRPLPRPSLSCAESACGRFAFPQRLHARQPPGFWERLSKSLIIERFLRQRVSALWVSFGRALFEFNLGAFAPPLHRGTPSCRPAFFMRQAIPFR